MITTTTTNQDSVQFNIGDRVEITKSYKPSFDAQFANLHGSKGTIVKTTIVKSVVSTNRKTMVTTYEESFGYEIKLDSPFTPYSRSSRDFYPVCNMDVKHEDLIAI
jgi:hypothetical protein